MAWQQVAKLLAHLKRLNKVLIHPDGVPPESVSYYQGSAAHCPDYAPEWVLGRPRWVSQEPLNPLEWELGRLSLLFEGTLNPQAGERNDIARQMHALLDPDGDRTCWHGPVAIAACSSQSGPSLPAACGGCSAARARPPP
ncbi:hypothetical protein [Streptomyces sp. NPDC058308]|uniref:hypothetical protein n=1 Tax=Streptomyces sp. NPDC058308 TaxID=3346440 RepID=UPI0036E20AF3